MRIAATEARLTHLCYPEYIALPTGFLLARNHITGVLAMTEKPGPSSAQQGVIDRLKQLRVQMFGGRGVSEFARALGISPGSYRRYEKDRVASVEVLAAAAHISGYDLYWLITGQRPGGASSTAIPADRQSLLDQIDRLAVGNPAALRGVRAFLDLLEQGALGSGQRPKRLSNDNDSRGGWLPVLGRSAADVVFFWKDLHNGSGKKPADRLSELIEAYLEAQTAGAWIASIQQADGQKPDTASDTVSLIQINVPSDAEIAEFLDCPAVRKRYPDAFALRIDGDSMLPQFTHGDLVIVSPSAPAVEGKPAVVQLRDQLGVTCKLNRREGDSVHLIPSNDSFSAQDFAASDILWALRVLFRVRIT